MRHQSPPASFTLPTTLAADAYLPAPLPPSCFAKSMCGRVNWCLQRSPDGCDFCAVRDASPLRKLGADGHAFVGCFGWTAVCAFHLTYAGTDSGMAPPFPRYHHACSASLLSAHHWRGRTSRHAPPPFACFTAYGLLLRCAAASFSTLSRRGWLYLLFFIAERIPAFRWFLVSRSSGGADAALDKLVSATAYSLPLPFSIPSLCCVQRTVVLTYLSSEYGCFAVHARLTFALPVLNDSSARPCGRDCGRTRG